MKLEKWRDSWSTLIREMILSLNLLAVNINRIITILIILTIRFKGIKL